MFRRYRRWTFLTLPRSDHHRRHRCGGHHVRLVVVTSEKLFNLKWLQLYVYRPRYILHACTDSSKIITWVSAQSYDPSIWEGLARLRWPLLQSSHNLVTFQSQSQSQFQSQIQSQTTLMLFPPTAHDKNQSLYFLKSIILSNAYNVRKW